MGKKKNTYKYKRRPKPDILEVLDTKLLRAYDWERNKTIIPVKVWRYIGLGVINEGDDPKAYWYIVEQIFDDDPEIPNTRTYGFFRRQQWDT